MKDLKKTVGFSQQLILSVFILSLLPQLVLASNLIEDLTPKVANSDVESIFCILPSSLPSTSGLHDKNHFKRWAATTKLAAYMSTGAIGNQNSPSWGYYSQMFNHVPNNSSSWDEIAYYFTDGDWKKEINNISTLNPANIRNILKAYNALSIAKKKSVDSISIFQIAIYAEQFTNHGDYEVLFKFNDANQKKIASFWNYFNHDNHHSYTTIRCRKNNKKTIAYQNGGASHILPILKPLFAYPQDHNFAISTLTKHIKSEYKCCEDLKNVKAETRLIDSFVILKYQFFDKVNQEIHTGDCRFKRLENGRYNGRIFSCNKTGKKPDVETTFSLKDNITPLVQYALRGTHYDFDKVAKTFQVFYQKLKAAHPSVKFPRLYSENQPDNDNHWSIVNTVSIPGFKIDTLLLNFENLSVSSQIELEYTLKDNNQSGKCVFKFTKGFVNDFKDVICIKN